MKWIKMKGKSEITFRRYLNNNMVFDKKEFSFCRWRCNRDGYYFFFKFRPVTHQKFLNSMSLAMCVIFISAKTTLKINILDMIELYLKSNETNMKNNIYIYAIQRMPMYTQQNDQEQMRSRESVCVWKK